ncbi:MAG: hypothetical protein ACYTHJ_13845 [Planctomycetota bacterium]|jgi:hypothetical protein
MDLVTIGVGLLVVLTAILVAFAAFLLWRHGFLRGWRSARSKPPRCFDCGYNLSGLTHCRCPECGREYRLEQLWQAGSPPGRRPQQERQQERVEERLNK